MSIDLKKFAIKDLKTHTLEILNGNIAKPTFIEDEEGIDIQINGSKITINIAKNYHLKHPLYIFRGATDISNINVTIEIKLEEGAKADIIELSYAPYKNGLTQEVTKSHSLKPQSILNYYAITVESETTNTTLSTTVKLDRESYFTHFDITLDSGKLHHSITANLNGEHAHSDMFGLYICDQKNTITHKVKARHKSRLTQSNQLYKGVLDGRSKALFDGMIYVDKNCKKVEASQLNKNILMTDQATITSEPKLEIYTDDVVCNHGAVSGQLDKEALFYMQARGIGIKKAKELLTYAFASEIIDMVKLAPLSSMLSKLLGPRLKESCHHISKK